MLRQPHTLPRIRLFLSLCPSLTSVLNPQLADSTPELDDSTPDESCELDDSELSDDTVHRARPPRA